MMPELHCTCDRVSHKCNGRWYLHDCTPLLRQQLLSTHALQALRTGGPEAGQSVVGPTERCSYLHVREANQMNARSQTTA